MSDDDKFEQWLQLAARDYNRPGEEIPRDAMWAAIEARTTAASATSPVVRPTRRVPTIWWQLAAALLLVAAGIGIGRQWGSTGRNEPTVANAVTSPSSSNDAATRDAAPLGTATAGRSGRTMPRVGGDGSESYDVATLEHLSRAEALLTSFRAAPGGDTQATMDRWARDLLGDTRLLLDSPAATDARRRQLLEDLELVLAQIVQLPAESSANRSLVQRSIERGAVLSRLRSTIPAGFARGT